MKTNLLVTVFFIISLLICAYGCAQPLTRAEIIQAANKVAMMKGLDLKKYNVIYDHDNIQTGQRIDSIKSVGSFGGRLDRLKKDNVQAVIYKKKGRKKSTENYTFFIDKNTGKVVGILKQR